MYEDMRHRCVHHEQFWWQQAHLQLVVIFVDEAAKIMAGAIIHRAVLGAGWPWMIIGCVKWWRRSTFSDSVSAVFLHDVADMPTRTADEGFSQLPPTSHRRWWSQSHRSEIHHLFVQADYIYGWLLSAWGHIGPGTHYFIFQTIIIFCLDHSFNHHIILSTCRLKWWSIKSPSGVERYSRNVLYDQAHQSHRKLR